MKRNESLEKIGFSRIINHNTHEVHNAEETESRCQIDKIKNGGYATKFWAWFLMARDKWFKYKKPHNGCAYCYESKNIKKK